MRLVLAFAVLLGATPVAAQDLPRQSRNVLGEAIRDVLIDTPALLTGLRAPPPLDLYRDEIDRDLDLLSRAAPRLFDPERPSLGPDGAPVRIALFIRADCTPCDDARTELAALAARMGFRATLFDMEQDAALARTLGLDEAPSYVLPDKMLRGAMPAIVLGRYLSE